MVYVGPGTDAVSAVCCLLVLLEEVRRSQDANTARLVGYIVYFVKLAVCSAMICRIRCSTIAVICLSCAVSRKSSPMVCFIAVKTN